MKDFLLRAAKLSSFPEPGRPFGLRYAVIERAAILHFDGGMPLEEADDMAWTLEVDGGQRRLGGVE